MTVQIKLGRRPAVLDARVPFLADLATALLYMGMQLARDQPPTPEAP